MISLGRTRSHPRETRRLGDGGPGTSLVLIAFVPAGVVAACTVVAALVVLSTAGGGLAGAFGAVGAMWMAIHQVPVYVGSLQLGVLPLLPTALLFAGVARFAARTVGPHDPPSRHLAVIASAAGGPALVTLVAATVMHDASASTPVATIGMVPSMLIVAVMHAAAALFGVGSCCVGRYVDAWGLSPSVPSVLRAGAAALAALLTAGAVLVVVGIIMGFGRVQEVFAAEPSIIGKSGLLVLSVFYLPNFAVGAAGVLVGTTSHVGTAGYSLFATHPGPVPDVPVAGALPDEPTSSVWALALAVTAGVVLWCVSRRGVEGRTVGEQLRIAVSVAAVAAAGALVLGYLAGGRLGVFDAVGLDAPVFAVSVLGWVAVAGTAVVLVRERAGGHGRGSGAEGLTERMALRGIRLGRSGLGRIGADGLRLPWARTSHHAPRTGPGRGDVEQGGDGPGGGNAADGADAQRADLADEY